MTKTGTITITGQPTQDDYAYVVPSVAHLTGSANTDWRTDVGVVNTASQTVTLHLTFFDYTTGAADPGHPRASTRCRAWSGGTSWSRSSASAAGSSVKGTLLVTSDQPLAVSSRTYNQESTTRTYGQSYPALVVAYPGGRDVEAVTNGRVGFIPLLKKNSAFRTHVGFVNLGTLAVHRVRSSWSAPTVALSARVRTLTADGHRWKQEDDIFAKSGAGNRDAAYARVEVSTLGCQAWAYASVIDQNTGDPRPSR